MKTHQTWHIAPHLLVGLLASQAAAAEIAIDCGRDNEGSPFQASQAGNGPGQEPALLQGEVVERVGTMHIDGADHGLFLLSIRGRSEPVIVRLPPRAQPRKGEAVCVAECGGSLQVVEGKYCKP